MPLDYSSAASPAIHIGFRWLPAPHPVGTVLAVEGGPGFATTGTEPAVPGDDGAAGPHPQPAAGEPARHRQLDPAELPGSRARQAAAPVRPRVQPAGRGLRAQLNHTWRYRGGGWVHASDLFNTAYSARDVSRVLRALRLGRVDLYGDSYGSWFAQVFASRYPSQLRSVTLDSTYQVLALDPWYTTTVVTARQAFAQACARSAACAAAAGRHGAWGRIADLARRLARAPVSGRDRPRTGTRPGSRSPWRRWSTW